MSHIIISSEDPSKEGGTSGRFKCDICDRSFKQKKDLLHHAYIHKENPKYDCPMCSKILTSKIGYDRHMGSHQKGRKAVHCKICQTSCATKTELEEHHRKHHLEQKPFACEICKAEFSWEENLHKHQRMHLVENYQCEMCNKVFVDTISLKVHMRTHTEKKNAPDSLKPYGCKLCGQRFQYDFSYNAHMRLHDAGVVPSIIAPTNKTQTNNQTGGPEAKMRQVVLREHIPDRISVGNVQMRKKANIETGNASDQENPELSNARILPAFVPPKNYHPYPKMLAHREKRDHSVKTSGFIKVSDVKDVSKNKDKKSKPVSEKRGTSLRFGDLSMTQETPYKCYLCDQSFRWEVSLTVHIDEHLKGPKLSAAEIRRRNRYALQRNMPSMLSRKRKPVAAHKQKDTISPKKSRLVKRKAGSDDEDSDVEVETQGTSPVKSKGDIPETRLETNSQPKQPKQVKLNYEVPSDLKQSTVQSTASQTNSCLSLKPILVEPQSGPTGTMSEKSSVEVSSSESGTQARTQTRNNTPPMFVISNFHGESAKVPYTKDSQSQSNEVTDSEDSTNQPVNDAQLKVMTRSRVQSSEESHSNEYVRSESNNKVLKPKPSKKRSPKRGGKKGKAKTKSDSPRRSARLKFSEPQTETEIQESVAELTEIANTTFEEAVASINVPLVDNSPELQSTEFKEADTLSAFDYTQDPQNLTAHALGDTQFEEKRSIVAISSEQTTDGPYFLSSQPHGPVIANIIHDDKTVEQVQVVECIKSAIKSDDDDDNDEAASIASIPEGAYEYKNQNEQLTEHMTVTQILDSQNGRQNPVYTSLRNVDEKQSATYTDLSNAPINEITSDNQRYQEKPYRSEKRDFKTNQVSSQLNDNTVVSSNYSHPAISIAIGDSIGSVANSTFIQSSPPKPKVTFSTIDSASMYGTANSILVQNDAERNNGPSDNRNENDYATNARATRALGSQKVNNHIARPIFTVNMTASANSQSTDSSPGVSVIEPMNEYVPFTGSMLEALNNQQPISATSFSHLYPGPIAEDIEGYPSRDKPGITGDSNPNEDYGQQSHRQIQDFPRNAQLSFHTSYSSQSVPNEVDFVHRSHELTPGNKESQMEQTLDLTSQSNSPIFSQSGEALVKKDSRQLLSNEHAPAQPRPRKSYSLPTDLNQELQVEPSEISQTEHERILRIESSHNPYGEPSRNPHSGSSHNLQLGNPQTHFSNTPQTDFARNLQTGTSHSSTQSDAQNLQEEMSQQKNRSLPVNQPVQTIMHQQVMGSQIVVQGGQGPVYQSHLMQNAVTVNRQGMVENKSQVTKEVLETSMPPNKAVHGARAVTNMQQANQIMNLAQPVFVAPGTQNTLQNQVLNITSQPPKPLSKTTHVLSNTKQHTALYQTINATESNQAHRLHFINSSSIASHVPNTGGHMIVSNPEALVTTNRPHIHGAPQQNISVSQHLSLDSQSLNQAVNLSIPRSIANAQHNMISVAPPVNIVPQNIISVSQHPNSLSQNVINLSQPIYSAPSDVVSLTQSLNTLASHNIFPKPAHSDKKRPHKQARQQAVVIQSAPATQMLLSPSRLNPGTIIPPSGIHGIQGSNSIIIQGQPAIQNLASGGIQVVNAQGQIQSMQTQGAVQVLSNQGLQTIQAPGALQAGLQHAVQSNLQPGIQPGLQTGLQPGLQVVQNVQQDNVPMIGAQPTQGGFQFVQTPTGIQVVPIQPSFTTVQGGFPFVQAGFQPQGMGPISMINMNITNNVQTPMQSFQTNVANLQGGIQMMPSAPQGLSTNMMSSPITCLNQYGEVVTVTPLFQIPMETLQNPQTVPVQNHIMSQNIPLNQGLVQIPITVDQHGNQLQALNMASNMGQSTSNSPINMVCKENPMMSERDTEANIEVMKDENGSSHLIVT